MRTGLHREHKLYVHVFTQPGLATNAFKSFKDQYRQL